MSPKHSWFDPHIKQSARSLLRVLFATAGVLVAVFVVFHIAAAVYTASLARTASSAFQKGIENDFSHLKESGDTLASSESLVSALVAGDSEKVLTLIKEASQEYSIATIGVANSEGVVVSRTKKLGVQGDNVFLTIPEGRIVSEGKSVQSIGNGVIDPTQIRMTTGRPVMQGEQMVGGLFTTYSMDDAFMAGLRDANLPAGVEVVSYNKTYGIYGNSFADSNIRDLVNSYFNSGSEWIQDGTTERTVTFGNGVTYLVENVVFSGIHESPSGALLFIPRLDIWIFGNVVTALITFLVFILLALKHHRRMRGEERGWRYFVMLGGVAFAVFAFTFFALQVQDIGRFALKRIPYVLYNSTLRLQPEFGIYNLGFEQRFSVIADTGDEPINALQIKFLFDPAAVLVKELDVASSTCSYIIEKTIDNTNGTAFLSCVILKSSEKGRTLPVADIVATPRRAGIFSFSFDPNETKILADDGLGTDVLRMAQSGSYRADTFDLNAQNGTTTSMTFVVFSTTHPNESRWYSAPDAHFIWRGKLGDVYRYAFDNVPDTLPTDKNTTQGLNVDIPIPGDGIFYFHLQLTSGGPIAHYRIQSDTTPPAVAAIRLSEDTVFVGDVVRVSFDAKDVASGIQKNYYIDLGSHLFLPAGSNLFIPFLEAGDQVITLRVYDGAGNYSERTQTIQVRPK